MCATSFKFHIPLLQALENLGGSGRIENVLREIAPLKNEVILVDDGSTDGSREIIREIGKKHKNARTVFHGKNLGIGLALSFPLVVGLVAWRSFSRLINPLARVMAAADAVAEGDLSVRVPEAGPGEFGRLARSFNRMVAELERSDRLRRSRGRRRRSWWWSQRRRDVRRPRATRAARRTPFPPTRARRR